MNKQSSFSDYSQFGQRSLFQDFIHEMPMFFKVMFLLVIGFFIFVIVKMLTVWMRNNASPLVSAYAAVVAKRTEVWGGSGDSSANTSYFTTFEFQDGSRLELQVHNRDFGLMVEGDGGELIYQGTRFKSFARKGVREMEDSGRQSN